MLLLCRCGCRWWVQVALAAASGGAGVGSGNSNAQAQAMLVEELQESLREAASRRQRVEAELEEERAAVQALRVQLRTAQQSLPSASVRPRETEAATQQRKDHANMLTSRLLCLFNRIRKLVEHNYGPASHAAAIQSGAAVVVLTDEVRGRLTAEDKTKYSGCTGTIVSGTPDLHGRSVSCSVCCGRQFCALS